MKGDDRIMAVTYNPVREKQAVGKFLTYHRKLQGLTRLEVCTAVNRSTGWLQFIEKGINRLYIDDAINLCKVLNVSLVDMAEFLEKELALDKTKE